MQGVCGRGSGVVSQERTLELFLRWTRQEMEILVRGKSMGKAQKYEEVFPGNTKWLAPGDKSSGRGDWRGEQRLGLRKLQMLGPGVWTQSCR